MTIDAQLENIPVEVAKRWEFLRDHADVPTLRRSVGAIARLAFTASLVCAQVLRRCLRASNPAEELSVAVLQERLIPEDVPKLLLILRANLAQIQLTLALAARSQGETFNAEELAVEYIALAERDLGILHQLQKTVRRTCSTHAY